MYNILSCDSLDLDSVSQVSLAESSPGPGDRDLVNMVKCVSSENISRAGNTRVKPDLIQLMSSYDDISPIRQAICRPGCLRSAPCSRGAT